MKAAPMWMYNVMMYNEAYGYEAGGSASPCTSVVRPHYTLYVDKRRSLYLYIVY